MKILAKVMYLQRREIFILFWLKCVFNKDRGLNVLHMFKIVKDMYHIVYYYYY